MGDIIGKILGKRYTILELVSGGGMAVVYKARCDLLNRIVAVKILKPEFAGDEDFVRRFRREAQAAASLSHPNIVGIYDVGEEDGLYYIVMEYVEGNSLKELIKQNAPMPIKDVIGIGIQICDALECAHRNKIVHRDIKSQNIMITPEGRVKVTDFGIARAASGSTITNTSDSFGSVQYFSPEQAKGEIVDERSDLYSLGVVLYEACTGRLPFDGHSPVSIALKQIQEPPAPISAILEGFPKGLEAVVAKCLAKIPGDRFQSAKELKRDLVLLETNPEVLEFEPTQFGDTIELDSFRKEVSKQEHLKKPKGNKILKTFGAALALIILFGVFSYLGAFLAKRYFEVPETRVPNLIGMTEEQAMTELKENKLTGEVSGYVFDPSPAGEVIDQDPKPNKTVKINHPPITLVVSKGPKTGPVPKILGLPEQDAVLTIRNAGFKTGDIKRENNEDFPEGLVIRQDPSEGVPLIEGSPINFTVSLGPKITQVQTPSLIGKTLKEAENLLAENQLAVGQVRKKVGDATEGTVVEQIPSAGDMTEVGGKVDIYISSGPLRRFDISIPLPAEPEEYRVRILLSDEMGNQRWAYNKKHSPEDSPLVVTLEGLGTMDVQVWIDDVLYHQEAY